MKFIRRFKENLATLVVGSALMFSGCAKGNVEGEVVREWSGIKGWNDIAFRAYLVKDEKDEYHIGVLEHNNSPDPFDKGDCAKLKLGDDVLIDDQYVNGELVARDGYKILKYEHCKK